MDGRGRRDGGYHGREGTEREQQRWQWSRSGWRRTRTHADTFVLTRASRAWPVNPTCGITWKVPQADSSLRELAQESAFSNNFYKWIRSLRLTEGKGGWGRGVSVIPGPTGAFPRGCCPRPGTLGVGSADTLPAPDGNGMVATRGTQVTRHPFLLSMPILDSRARSGMPHTIKKCPARRDLEAGA